MSSSSFAGEPYLQATLPSYESSRLVLTVALVLSAVVWTLLVPILGAKPVETQTAAATAATATTSTPAPSSSKRKKGKSSNGEIKEAKSKPPPETPPPVALEIPLSMTVYSVVGLMVTSVLMVLLYSPNNVFTTRQVFQAPLFSEAECQKMLQMADTAATVNYQKAMDLQKSGHNDHNNKTSRLLEEPHGWQKSRHSSYPTTDLNLVTDPFTAEDRAWLGDMLDRRMTPVLRRLYGLTAASIRANDMFVVRYDADDHVAGGRRHLQKHTDEMDISFNVLLQDDFTGGGTRFWNRAVNEPFAHAHPAKGQVLMHSALIHHEGMPVETGTRIIFVGFLSVDRLEPFRGQHTGLSVYASWLNLAWVNVMVKASYFNGKTRRAKGQTLKWFDSLYWRSLFHDLVLLLEFVGDRVGLHGLLELVGPDQTDAYLQALDDDAASPSKQEDGAANWFAGQLIEVDVDGSIAGEYTTRQANRHLFEEL